MKMAVCVLALVGPVFSLAAGELSIATYNIENYVATNRMTRMGYRRDYPKSEVAKQALREVIRQLDADVLVLQEMGPPAYLAELQRDLAAQGTPYGHAVLMQGADEDRHVAVLSRQPFAKVQPHAGLVFKYQGGMEAVKRGLLEVVIDTPLGPLTLWALHLKSRYTDEETDPESAQRRAGEAMTIREFILKQTAEPAETLFMILGDFNDHKRSAAVRYLTRRGKLNFARLLPANDEHGEHWTYHYRREDSYARVDHVLVSPALWHAVEGGEARIMNGEAVRLASDHRPLKVTLGFDDETQVSAAISQTSDATSATNND